MQRYIILICGVFFLGIGVFLYMRNQSLIKNCTVETEATVVDMKQDLSTDDTGATYMYYPIIEYKAGENTVRVTMEKASNTPEYNINQKITILYNPNKVKQFIVKGEKSSAIFSIIFMAIGVLVAGVGVKEALKKN